MWGRVCGGARLSVAVWVLTVRLGVEASGRGRRKSATRITAWVLSYVEDGGNMRNNRANEEDGGRLAIGVGPAPPPRRRTPAHPAPPPPPPSSQAARPAPPSIVAFPVLPIPPLELRVKRGSKRLLRQAPPLALLPSRRACRRRRHPAASCWTRPWKKKK
uniref:Uncharacterized protein n=1 Tax=Oryza rufipogon TaxID=4529 RepID=A0A0E0RJZ2_ORYRU